MKSYPSYKESEIEWIGEIPNHWFVNKVSRNTYVKGRIGWKGLKSDEFVDDGPYLITGTDFKKGRIDWNNTYHISQERFEEDPFIILKEGDVLITKDGTIGKIVYVDYLPGQTTLNSGIFITRPVGGEYKSLFFYWLLNSNVFQIFFDYESNGSTIQHLYQNVFEDFKFPIPPTPEQKQIVSFLDHKTQKIDELIEKTDQKIELLKEKRTSLINHCVTKGLNPNVEMKDSGVEWIGEIPNNFIIGKLGFYCKVFRGSGYQYLNQVDDDFIGKKEKVVRISDFSKFNPIWCEYIEQFENYRIRTNNILVGGTGHYFGKSMFVTEEMEGLIHSYNIIRLEIYQQFPKFIQYYISSNLIREQMDISVLGSGQPFIDIQGLKDLHLIIPSMKEQTQIVKYLDEQTQKIDSTIEKETQRTELLKEYRQSLISEVVTGKIDVRDWKR